MNIGYTCIEMMNSINYEDAPNTECSLCRKNDKERLHLLLKSEVTKHFFICERCLIKKSKEDVL